MENNLDNLFENAAAFYDQKKYDQSKKLFEQLVESGFKVAKSYYYLGLIEYNSGHIEAAHSFFSKTVEIDPNDVNGTYLLGLVFEKVGNLDWALHYYGRTLEILPTHTGARDAQKRLLGSQNKVVPVVKPLERKGEEEIQDEPFLGDIFDQLKEADDEASIRAVAAIRNARIINRKPRLRAFISSFFLTLLLGLILFPIFSLLLIRGLGGVFFKQIAGMPKASADELGLTIFVVSGLVFVLFFIILKIKRVKSTILTIDRGNIIITKGLFYGRREIVPIYKCESFSSSQGFFNRLTNDGVLVVHMPRELHRIRGIAKYDEIKKLADQLTSLRLQIRSTQIGKGVMN